MRRWMILLLAMLWAGAARGDMAAVVPPPQDPAARLQLPPGFSVSVFARLQPAGGDYFRGPRFMAFGPDGHLYLSLGLDHRVVMLPDADGDGRADRIVTVADGLNGPQGLAFVQGRLYVANQDGIVRLEHHAGRWPANGVTPVVGSMPQGGHTLKTLRQGPDGFLYVNVGSSCNVCAEEDPLRATLLRYTIDGKPAGATTGSPVWAVGLRNAQGFAWHPVTGAMYATNNGADMRAASPGLRPDDDLPPEHLSRIQPGAHYGWPHCWGVRQTDPNFPGPAGFCARTSPPELLLPAHSTPIGIVFLDRARLPAEYSEDALVALHGSWNRRSPSGYKVVRVHFEGGQPVRVTDFITGWLDARGAWGRPVDVAVGPDGALYVSDDRAGMIYRIRYEKEPR